uniref:Expansin-like EG45 domain-containing protein n=1 Tax=Spongospora subterranea TaxID=70186 RepID=A0A0H5RS28_9EUKA|eukprot:CRZ11539.1 hypothetical protein [Spongospora subterranea]
MSFAVLVMAILVCASINLSDAACATEPVYSGVLEAFPLYDSWLAGSATSTPTSSCNNEKLFFPNKDDRFVAISYGPMESGVGCGRCINISSNTGNHEILTAIEGINKVNDGDVQIATSVANRLGGSQVSWQFVPCPVSGTIKYSFSEGATTANTAWIGFSNFGIGIREVSVKIGSAWNQLQRSSSTVNWNLPQGSLQLPLVVSLVSTGYETVQFRVPAIIGDGSSRDSGVAFTGSCIDPPTTAPLTPQSQKTAAKSGTLPLNHYLGGFVTIIIVWMIC